MTAGQSGAVVGQSLDTHDDPSTMSGRSTSHGKKGGLRLKRNRYVRGVSGSNNGTNESLTNGMDDNEPSTGSTGSDSGMNRVRWTRPALLRRSLSGPEADGRGSSSSTFGSRRTSPRTPTSDASNKSKSGFRLGRPRLKLGRSHSLPTQHLRLSDDSAKAPSREQDDGSKSMGSNLRVRTQTGVVYGTEANDAFSRRKGGKKGRKSLRLPTIDFLRPSLPQRNESGSKDSSSNNSTKGSLSEESREGPHHSSSEDEVFLNHDDSCFLRKTQVVPHLLSPEAAVSNNNSSGIEGYSGEPVNNESSTMMKQQGSSDFMCSSTAILQHSYLEMLCGRFDFHDGICLTKHPEDPTVQESIECIFESQLEDGLQIWDDEEGAEKVDRTGASGDLISPADLLQSRQNRSDRGSSSVQQNKKRYQQASLVYVGTYDPSIPDDSKTIDEPCPCSRTRLPTLDPKDWPQAPLLLRPTPGSGTKVKGIRFGKSKEYLWEPGSHTTWPKRLAEHWGIECHTNHNFHCCEKCAIMPINNGNEPHGESLVVDFESELFEGTIMCRLRFSNGTTPEPYDDKKGYFRGVNRRYQTVIRGRFKKSLPFTELMTGFQLERPFGKLPPRWIVGGGLKVLSFFAPQLHAKLDCQRPHTFAPLGSTPQSIAIDFGENDLLEDVREEPSDTRFTLLGERSVASSSLQRARARKKAFDKQYAKKTLDLQTDPLKTYTFEFLQHLFNPQEFYVDLGSMLGSIHLEDILDGQPLPIMSSHGDGDTPLWSFDVWHECLWERANHYERQSSK